MKRLMIIMFMMACSVMDLPAQEKFIDHLAIGVNIGTTSMRGKKKHDYIPGGRQTDGYGIEVAAQIFDWMDVRTGFSMTNHGSVATDVNVEGVPGGRYVSGPVNVFCDSRAMAGNLSFDFFPFRNTTFHFSAGLFAGSTSLMRIYGRTPVPEELATYNVGVAEFYGMSIPTDRDGRIAAEVRMPAVRPFEVSESAVRSGIGLDSSLIFR